MVKTITRLCKERGKTLSDVEEACNIGVRSIYRWDTNKPSVDKVQRVATYLGVTVDELLTDDG